MFVSFSTFVLTGVQSTCPPPSQVILSLFVIMYICIYSKYCKGGVFFRTGLGKVECMQVCGCVEWG